MKKTNDNAAVHVNRNRATTKCKCWAVIDTSCFALRVNCVSAAHGGSGAAFMKRLLIQSERYSYVRTVMHRPLHSFVYLNGFFGRTEPTLQEPADVNVISRDEVIRSMSIICPLYYYFCCRQKLSSTFLAAQQEYTAAHFCQLRKHDTHRKCSRSKCLNENRSASKLCAF